ncbi:N-acetylmuramoyl-L-alanine amidase family protein [Clostridium sp. E02]|uniref:N-acetylmuramoyl-L-alanine amidase family protein n=1 Tax=Clostridium sp. E02 TaxID=2487134 RepID=UPI000F5466B1|nr:N-acetylmuramoyl-L-alanine amidase family protein [Clostridium sp. E02]
MRWMKGKGIWLFFLCTGILLATAMSSLASVDLKIRLENGRRSDWTDGIQTPTVTVNYSEENPDWNKPEDEWKPGKKITGSIRVSGNYQTSDCTVYGGKLISVRAENGETVIRFSYIPVAKLECPERAGWSDNTKTKASWKKVPFASRYQVVLYKEGGIWLKSLTTSSTSVDLMEYLDDGNKYYYTVKAIVKNSSEDDYLKEGDTMTSDDSVVQEIGDNKGIWINNEKGKRYRAEDGEYVKNSWKMITGDWYYFDQDGYAVTGWLELLDKWYYMGNDSKLKKDWQQIGETWYYFNTDGDMATGWIQPQPGKWYYLNADGSMATNTTVEGIYKLNSNGLWES